MAEWRSRFVAVADAADQENARALRAALDALGLPDEEVEIEREMLDGLDEMLALAPELERSGLPILETGHRVVGSDRCHFTAPASMPDDPAQPSGRLLFTNTRAVFVGGARAVTLPWHALSEPRRVDRDLLLIRADRQAIHRFRCNSFGAAMRAALLARHLTGRRR